MPEGMISLSGVTSVNTITKSITPGVLIFDLVVSGLEGEQISLTSHAYRADDPYGINPMLKDWLADNPGFPIGDAP